MVAADVYAKSPHVGRGGWTWYTGTAGWMQRAGTESILGLKFRGDFLHLDPCIPPDWKHFEMLVRHRSAQYDIQVENPNGVCRGIASMMLDGVEINDRPRRVPLLDDGQIHRVRLTLCTS